MGIISDLMTVATGIIASAEDSVTVTFDGDAIDNVVFHERSATPAYDELRDEEYLERNATITFPTSGPQLTPQKDTVIVDGAEWRVIQTVTEAEHRQYTIARRDDRRTKRDRGASQ